MYILMRIYVHVCAYICISDYTHIHVGVCKQSHCFNLYIHTIQGKQQSQLIPNINRKWFQKGANMRKTCSNSKNLTTQLFGCSRGNMWLCFHANCTERFHLVSKPHVYVLEVLFKFHKSCHISGYSQYQPK